MENTIQQIIVHAQEVKKEKQSFIACSAEIANKWYKIKFTKDCFNSPREKGLYHITLDFDKCSVEFGKRYTNSRGEQGVANDTIWVREIVQIRKFTEEELKAQNRMAMRNIFGVANNTDSDLPF